MQCWPFGAYLNNMLGRQPYQPRNSSAMANATRHIPVQGERREQPIIAKEGLRMCFDVHTATPTRVLLSFVASMIGYIGAPSVAAPHSVSANVS
jgi:hypothetical protein